MKPIKEHSASRVIPISTILFHKQPFDSQKDDLDRTFLSFIISKTCLNLGQVSVLAMININDCISHCIIFIGISVSAISQCIKNILVTGIAISSVLFEVHSFDIDSKVKPLVELCWASEIDIVTPICFHIILISRCMVSPSCASSFIQKTGYERSPHFRSISNG